ncbi:MAG: MAPEG family protein [Gammaproteobacteria bacterium]|nr:MAG: MAPEG family protein [Gammaproteobacteria bacterium]
MSPSATALAGFAAWTLILVLMIGLYRSYLVLTGQRASNQFDPSGADVGEFSRRLCRAHANCYENLPIFGALIAVALITGKSALTDGLAMWFLAARIAQSVIHLSSTSPTAVTIRFGLYLAQWMMMAIMAVRLLAA